MLKICTVLNHLIKIVKHYKMKQHTETKKTLLQDGKHLFYIQTSLIKTNPNKYTSTYPIKPM
jgi:hypothetical protein